MELASAVRYVFAAEEDGLDATSGLWPVYVAAFLAILAICVFVGMRMSLRSMPDDNDRSRLNHNSVVYVMLALTAALAAVGAYLIADARYDDCLSVGNVPFGSQVVPEGRVYCERAVFGPVRFEP